jgi:hypothetical protein
MDKGADGREEVKPEDVGEVGDGKKEMTIISERRGSE